MSSDVPLKRHDPCDLCGENAFQVIAQSDRRGKPLDTVICRYCGLVSHARVPSADELSAYYHDAYRTEYQGEFCPSGYRVVREWNRGKDLVRRLRQHLSQDDRIFEVGSGIGCNLMSLADEGYTVRGIEPNIGYWRFSHDELGAPVELQYLEESPRLPVFDVILLVHVLEHLRSPSDTLAQLRSMLRAGGRVYVEVPNFAAPHAAPNKWFHFAHIYNFTPSSLTMLANQAGFDVQQVGRSERRNLRMLLTRRDDRHWQLDTTNYASTLRGMNRYNWLTYHGRLSYLAERTSVLAGRLGERILTQRRVDHIREVCTNLAASSTINAIHADAA